METKDDGLAIEVVYAEQGDVDRTALTVAPGTCIRESIIRSGLPARHPELDLDSATIGIFGRVRDIGEAVCDGDRVEIYRPLQADPKLARRQRVRIGRRLAVR